MSVVPPVLLSRPQKSATEGTAGKLVPARMLNESWAYLQQHGTIRRRIVRHEIGLLRSATVCALLARMPGVEVHRGGQEPILVLNIP